ncbi:MAG: glycogen/starch synthase [Candidatus Pacearchaeota archaeon]|jgi:glycogen synthase
MTNPDQEVHTYFSPFGNAQNATYVTTRRIENLKNEIKTFNIHKKKEVTPIILISPEVGKLPKSAGEFAPYISGKSGGLGEVVCSLHSGLKKLGLLTYLITGGFERRFLEEAKIDKYEFMKKRHSLDHGNIKLVSSPLFSDKWDAYDGNEEENAAEFQKLVVMNEIPEITSKYDGRGIICNHDWFSGGLISAYANYMNLPSIFVNHNWHTRDIALDNLRGAGIGRLWDNLHINYDDNNKRKLRSAPTAIKNCSLNAHVGKEYLEEIMRGEFDDKIDFWYKHETCLKNLYGKNIILPNGISPEMYPENQRVNPNVNEPGLAKSFSENSRDIIEAKKANLLKFQQKTGLKTNPDAILFFWASRLDPTQKGIQIAEKVVGKFAYDNPDVQFAFIGNGVGGDKTHENILGKIACSSNGQICSYPFNDDLSILAYAACDDSFGCSLYEPFGLNDVGGNLCGATATNRDTGGYHDKIKTLRLKSLGATRDHGNGFLFKNYDEGGLWYGLNTSLNMHRYLNLNLKEKETQLKRIIRETKEKHSQEEMTASYLAAFEKINGKPLI